jgi:hypothetical protein
MRLAERHRMDAGNVEFAKQHDHVAAHKGYVEIARSRTFAIERFSCFPLVSCNAASTEDHVDAIRCRLAQYTQEFVEASLIAAEREADHSLADLALRAGVRRVIARLGVSPANCHAPPPPPLHPLGLSAHPAY